MRRAVPCVLLFLVSVVPAISQSNEANETETLRQLREAITALNQARQELQQSRSDLETLKQQVAELRAKVDTPSAGTPSADDRISKLEEEQQVQASRLEQQYQTKVESGSKYRVRLSGLVLFNAVMNSGAVNDQDVPNLALRKSFQSGDGNVSASLRQTQFTLDVAGPTVAGARTSASASLDFFGGFPQTLDGVSLGLARLRTARAEFDWAKWNLKLAQEQPFISPRNPTSLASVGTPSLGYSGNLWTWTPQIVLRRRWTSAEESGFSTEVGLLDPLSGEIPQDEYLRKPESGERSRVPAMAIRQSYSANIGDEKLEIGASGYYSRHDYGFSRSADAWAGTLDWSLPLSHWAELSGEFYRGRSLGGLWGGIGTSVVYTGAPSDPTTQVLPVDTIGGWSQMKIKPTQRLEFNLAFGQDNPFANQVRHQNIEYNYAPMLRNQTLVANVIQRLRSNLLLSLEYRHLDTTSFGGYKYTADHVNAAVGVQF